MEVARDPPANQGFEWLNNERSTLLVVITLITTLTFQVGINPPGGFWQDDANNHTAGTSIMQDKHHHRYVVFKVSNWLCFHFSMTLVVWILAGVSLNSRWFKVCFAFCLATVEFIYLTSQPGSLLRWALVTGILVFLLAAFSFFTARRN